MPGKKGVGGQKKSKQSIIRAATQKKGSKKVTLHYQKWSKGKVKQKVDHAVFLDQPTYQKILKEIPRMGKLISVSNVIEKFKVTGQPKIISSIARRLIKECYKSGDLKRPFHHSKQFLYMTKIQRKEEGQKKVVQKAKAQKKKKPPK